MKLLGFTGLVIGGVILAGAVKTKDAKPCSRVEIHYNKEGNKGFVPSNEIIKVIEQSINHQPVGQPLKVFNLKEIERRLEEYAWVLDAQLYFDNTQTLHVLLVEAMPVARCMDKAGNQFYLDRTGIKLPISKQFRADVPVFTNLPASGKKPADSLLINRITQLASAIIADSFWMAQAAQIDVLPKGNLEMIPAIGNHVVELGYGNSPEEMLNRLKVFYQAMAAAGRLEDYQRINASFDKQIVAHVQHEGEISFDKQEAINTYRQMVIENKSTVNTNSVVTENKVGRIVSEAPPVSGEGKPNKKPNAPDKGAISAKKELKNSTNRIEIEKTPKEEKVPKAVMPKNEEN